MFRKSSHESFTFGLNLFIIPICCLLLNPNKILQATLSWSSRCTKGPNYFISIQSIDSIQSMLNCGRSAVTRVRLDKHGGEKALVHRRRFLKIYSFKFCDIWQNFYFYCILNNGNFKTEVEQTNFVSHLIITVQLYY